VIDLYTYWGVEPPVHDLARIFMGYKPVARNIESDMKNLPPAALTPAEVDFMSRSGTPKTADNLPLHVQKWMQDVKIGKARIN